MAQSRNKAVKAMAEKETTYGTAPTWAPSADGILLFDNANPVALDTSTVTLTPLQTALTRKKNLIGRQLYKWSGKLFLQGSGTKGTVPRFNDLLTACALQETVAAGSSVTYAPRSTAFDSASIATDLDGIKYLITGAYGTFTMSGSAGQGVDVSFDMQGLYNGPDPTLPSFAGWAGGTNNAATMKSANLVINNGTITWDVNTPSADPLVFKSFSFTRGVVVGERADANAADALAGINVDDAEPKLEIVVEAKDNLTSLPNVWDDLKASTTHNVTFSHGSTAGNIVDFAFPQAQLEDAQPTDSDGGTRAWTLTYNVQHDTDDQEFSIVFQ